MYIQDSNLCIYHLLSNFYINYLLECILSFMKNNTYLNITCIFHFSMFYNLYQIIFFGMHYLLLKYNFEDKKYIYLLIYHNFDILKEEISSFLP